MTYTLLDGKKLAAEEKQRIAEDTKLLNMDYGVTPGLAVVVVGDDPASEIYVRNKEKACAEVGFYSEVHRLPADCKTEDVLEKLEEIKADKKIHGILVQLPLPPHIDEQEIILAIPPEKDVDGFHPKNLGHLMNRQFGYHSFIPCTPKGIIRLLIYNRIVVGGKHCVVVGRSNIVGKPMAAELLNLNGTVTICHSYTKNLAEITKQADILVVAVGKPNFITADMVKEGIVVVDVGINRLSDGKLVGDVAFDEVCKKASAITPVPGGVGPMTIAALLGNTLFAAQMYSLGCF